MSYRGTLTEQERDAIDQIRHGGGSVRGIADVLGLPYGKVRGYIEYTEAALEDLIPPPLTGAKILVYDVETTPLQGWTWGKYQQNVLRVDQNWYMLCVAYKWLGQDEMGFFSIQQDPAFKPHSTDDRYVALRLHRLLDQADIVIGHNSDKFDNKKANSLFRKHHLGPTSLFESIDTVKAARKYLGEYSNSLKDLAKTWDLTRKIDTGGLKLWFDCMAGEGRAWVDMEEYNKGDVITLEELYLEVRPYMTQHPNLGHYSSETVCPKCGGNRFQLRGTKKTKVSVFRTVQCKDCGGYSRHRLSDRQILPEDKIELV